MKPPTLNRFVSWFATALAMHLWLAVTDADAAQATQAQANCVAEVALTMEKSYANPFMDVTLDALVTAPDGRRFKVPAFWAGGNEWRFRYSSAVTGTHAYRTECSDPGNPKLHGVEGRIEIGPYRGESALYRHGPVRVAAGRRHFKHADGTPFFWLGDTWWKNLCRRMTWEGFQELTADRKAKGFNVVQIVCGPYPDEGFLEPRLANEGGLPYESVKFERVNPKYFDYADRRLKHLVDAGIAPAIVGAWGRGDCNSMEAIGAAGLKRHWRYLVARYSAYPVFWILAGEIPEETKWGKGPWAEVAEYLRSIDPYHRPLTCHTAHGRRGTKGDVSVIDYDMVGGNHDERVAVEPATLAIVTAAYAKDPPMPVLVGETCYEGHMQQGFGDVQRRMFWGNMLNGAAGHTYGAAGVWHASVEGDPGCASSAFGGTRVYDWTTWKEGMNYPGATQLGIGKKLLEQYPWARFEPHPEWTDGNCIAAGIPGEVRFVYQPRRKIYDWKGPVVKNLERGVRYAAFYFDPATGRRFDAGTFVHEASLPQLVAGHSQPLLVADGLATGEASVWKDFGTPTKRMGGRLSGGKGMVTVLENLITTNLMASVDARSDAEAGIILRFHDADNYLVALYSPSLKAIFLHDRKGGRYGEALGVVAVPDISPQIQISAAVFGEYAAIHLTDGKKSYHTPTVRIGNLAGGKAGLWFYQIGERQEFSAFQVSKARLAEANPAESRLSLGEFKAPPLPSPQDWVLVMEREKDWPPTRTATLRGKTEADLTINGRPCELFRHGVKPEWGYPAPQQDAFVVIHPKHERKNAPLYVVLHSAGHDVIKCLNCTRDVGNHDLYRSPDDFYALYLDCRSSPDDWWWGGMHSKDPNLTRKNSGGDPTPVENRVIDTVKWAIQKYEIDPNRAYLCGISMGGSGALGIGMRNGDVFAAIKASIPAGIEHVSERMYFQPRSIPENVRIPDPPIAIDESAQNDNWSVGHERFVSAMNDRHYALLFFWGPFGHADNHLLIEKVNDLASSFDWLQLKRNEAYPVFANATSNPKLPWPDDLKSASAGQVNAFFRWKSVSDTKKKLEMTLFLVSSAELRTTFAIPMESTTDISLRRIQNGPIPPGGAFRWTFGTAKGEGKADAEGLITIPRMKITTQPTTLTVRK